MNGEGLSLARSPAGEPAQLFPYVSALEQARSATIFAMYRSESLPRSSSGGGFLPLSLPTR